MAYAAHVLTEKSRTRLLTTLPPRFSRVVAHHVTVKFGVPVAEPVPELARVEVVGYAMGDGVEALVVSVDGEVKRADGGVHHVTWSLEEGRKPVESNEMIKRRGWTRCGPYAVDTVPKVLR